MAVPQHLEDAVNRLKDASRRIDQARPKASTIEHLREGLVALTDFPVALSDIQRYNNEAGRLEASAGAGRRVLRRGCRGRGGAVKALLGGERLVPLGQPGRP